MHNRSQVIVGDFPTPETIIAAALIGVHNSRLLAREIPRLPKTVTSSNKVQVSDIEFSDLDSVMNYSPRNIPGVAAISPSRSRG
jgi:hypothetical protein